MKKQTWLYLLLVLVFVAAVAWLMRPAPVAVDLATIQRGRLRVTVDEDGRTRIREVYAVSTPLAGRLLRVEIEPGDTVYRGKTLLATLQPRDPSLLDARELASAQARVKARETELARAAPELERARAALDFAETDLARTQQAVERRAASREAFELAQMAYRQRQEDFRVASFSQQVAAYELELAKAALLTATGDTNANDDGSEFQIHSPIDGKVLRVFQESATVVEAGAELLSVGDPTDLEVEVDVLSSDAVKIAPDADVILEHWGGDRPLAGKVTLVEPSGFTKISALGVEEQRVNVIVDLTDPLEERERLGDGFRVEARIVAWEGDDVLKVPTSALFRADEDWTVFVADQGRARQQPVTIGHRNSDEAEVLDGLQVNQQVVLHPSDLIEDGVLITPR